MSTQQTVVIDDREYDFESLSDDAKGQLQSLHLVDRRIAEAQQDLAILQTARNAYANALRKALPADTAPAADAPAPAFDGDTLKFS